MGAAALLGELRDGGATGPLVQMLEDPDPEARRAAAEALGRIQDPQAAEALLLHSADSDFEVRNAAQRALDALGTAGIVWSAAIAARGALERIGEIVGAQEAPLQIAEGNGDPGTAAGEAVLPGQPRTPD